MVNIFYSLPLELQHKINWMNIHSEIKEVLDKWDQPWREDTRYESIGILEMFSNMNFLETYLDEDGNCYTDLTALDVDDFLIDQGLGKYVEDTSEDE